MARRAGDIVTSTFNFLKVLEYIPLAPKVISILYRIKTPSLAVSSFGLKFRHPVGIAAGLDKTGDLFHLMDNYGPAFIETGPLHDVRPAIANLQKNKPETVIFANLDGDDLERSFSLIYDFVDAIVLNVSDNTTVSEVIDRLVTLRRYNDEYRPILFNIAPEISSRHLEEVVHYVLASGLDGIMAPLSLVKEVVTLSQNLVSVIAVDEFQQMNDVRRAFDDGASFVALKSAQGRFSPSHVKKVLKFLLKKDNKK